MNQLVYVSPQYRQQQVWTQEECSNFNLQIGPDRTPSQIHRTTHWRNVQQTTKLKTVLSLDATESLSICQVSNFVLIPFYSNVIWQYLPMNLSLWLLCVTDSSSGMWSCLFAHLCSLLARHLLITAQPTSGGCGLRMVNETHHNDDDGPPTIKI